MFGYLRFFLAFLVLLSHADVRFYGLNPGVIAVVIFYILAGFVVSHLYEEILPDTKYKILNFYKDRALRIFPLYMYIVVLTIIFLLLTAFGEPSFTSTKMLANLLIVPLNYYMYYDFTILKDPNWWLIPPAWSLGTELQAYLLLPFVLTCKGIKYAATFFSLFIYILANLSILNPDYFGYRFIVGVFFIFIVGTSIQKAHSKKFQILSKFDKFFPVALWFIIALLVPIFVYTHSFSPTYTKETFIGLLVGIPIVMMIAKIKQKFPLDKLLASLSYGIFLSHFLVIWFLAYFGFSANQSFKYLTTVTLISLAISFIGVAFVEKYVNKLRYIRKVS